MAHLAPAAGRCTEVHHMMHALQYGEGLINLQELEGAACSPALLLCLAVVNVSLVLSVGIPFSSCQWASLVACKG